MFDELLPYLNEEFSKVDEKSIREVVRHGLAMMALFKTKNHDLYLNDTHKDTYMYVGPVSHNRERRYEIHNKKIKQKIRIMYALKKTPYSGFMYFWLNEYAYTDLLNGQTTQRIILFKCLEEAKLVKNMHYYRIAMEEPRRWIMIIEDLDISTALELQ